MAKIRAAKMGGSGSAECKCICLAVTANTPIIDTDYVTDSYVVSGSNRIHTLTFVKACSGYVTYGRAATVSGTCNPTQLQASENYTEGLASFEATAGQTLIITNTAAIFGFSVIVAVSS